MRRSVVTVLFASDSEFWGFRDRAGGEGGLQVFEHGFMCGKSEIGNRNCIKWFKLRGVGVKLTQRYLTAFGEEVWARRVPGTEETWWRGSKTEGK